MSMDSINSFIRTVCALIDLKKARDDSIEINDEFINENIKLVLLSMIEQPFLSSEEIISVKKDIEARYQIYTTPGYSILNEYEDNHWYSDIKDDIDHFFWNRYKNYLLEEKRFSPNVVSVLGNETLDNNLMNYLGNPKSTGSFLKRGLVIGDVQSGKTSTYIGLICKAADAGYKVFILLTGTIENLRVQTQKRVEEGFIGIDMSSSNGRVGVGKDNKPIRATIMTSRDGDFKSSNQKIAVALSDKEAVVFVIKKQKNALKNLIEWLQQINGDGPERKISIPMLMIDDEADNASINTKTEDDPTLINSLIRELANVFTKSNYVGFTATPFANVFIDPNATKDTKKDLFPEDFIYILPKPTNYIGPEDIYRESGKYHNQLIYIKDAGFTADDGYSFYCNHKKEWEDEFPNSLKDAIYTFYLANAIRDYRGDKKQHRTMMINVSRFIKVQHYAREYIDDIHRHAYSAIRTNLSNNLEECLKDPIISQIYKNYKIHYANLISWKAIVELLAKSIENIVIKVINTKDKDKLVYSENESKRVIAIGGLALSRGLTLEGLITSYFCRNTCTYDVLMQMGRWFGYRPGYDDLFRIWTMQESAEWYGEITEAIEQLKDDMVLMKDMQLKPKDFGIRVKDDSDDLNITARNKMKHSESQYEYNDLFGDFIETPYLDYNLEKNIANYRIVEEFLSKHIQDIQKAESNNYLITKISKIEIIHLLSKLSICKYNSYFKIKNIKDFLEFYTDDILNYIDVAIITGSGKEVEICGRKFKTVSRNHCEFIEETKGKYDFIKLGTRGKLAGPLDSKVGILDFKGHSAQELISKAIEKFTIELISDSQNMSNKHWFSLITKRRPVLYIYPLSLGTEGFEKSNEKQSQICREFLSKMGNCIPLGFAFGVPNLDDIDVNRRKRVRQRYNKTYPYRRDDSNEGVEE